MKRLPLFLLILAICAATLSTPGLSQVPRNINYQGVLTDQNGVPVDGSKSIAFKIYNVATGGTPLYTQGPQNVNVKSGVFNVVLGPIQLPFDVPYFLETVVEQSTLIPRAALGSAPYGIRAARADSAGNADHANNSDHANNADHSSRSDTSHHADHSARSDTSHHADHSARSDTSTRSMRSDRSNRADTTDLALAVLKSSVNSVSILDGSIGLIDIGQNGAAPGQVIKWNGAGWAAGNDEGSAGDFLPLAGGIMTGAIASTNNPPITMGKGNFGAGNVNSGLQAFVAGASNSATGDNSAIAGGSSNQAVGSLSTIGGGTINIASGDFATVPGGRLNAARGTDAFAAGVGARANHPQSIAIAAGGNSSDTTATGGVGQIVLRANGGVYLTKHSEIAAPYDSSKLLNTSAGAYLTTNGNFVVPGLIQSTGTGFKFPDGTTQTSAATGGSFLPLAGGTMTGPITNAGNPSITMGKGNFGAGNANVGAFAFVAGNNNRASGDYSTVFGGGGNAQFDSNSASGNNSSVGGGRANRAKTNEDVVSGGFANIASGGQSAVLGGNGNQASGTWSAIGGGASNIASGTSSTIPGGILNAARVGNSFAAGSGSKANHNGSVVIAANGSTDSTASGGPEQMVLRGDGGIYFTNHQENAAPYDTSKLINTSAGAYLKTDGSLTLPKSLTVGGGTAILKVLSASATLDFQATPAQSSSTLTLTLTGAAVGDVVTLGIPNNSVVNMTTYMAWVSTTNVVAIRFQNLTSGSVDPAAGAFRVAVMKF